MSDSATLQRCLAYVESQLGPRLRTSQNRRLVAPTVTISRQTGSGGIPIAERLAVVLQEIRPGMPAPWTVFHRTLVEKVLEEHNLPDEIAKYMPEDRVSYIQDTMEELLGLHPSSTSLVTQVTQTILGLAELGNAIIIGRGAHVVLASHPNVFRVRLVSALPNRIQRVMIDKKFSESEAAAFVRREDRARARYLRTHFQADLEDPLGYHLILNTDDFPLADAADLLAHAITSRFPPAR